MNIPPAVFADCDNDYFFLLPPEAFLDAFKGLTFVSSSLISILMWLAKLQIPLFHFFTGAG